MQKGLSRKRFVVRVREGLIIGKEAISFYFVICKLGWWKRFPFLPIPSIIYIRWRLDTAYGTGNRPSMKVMFNDICKFLLWRHKYGKGH